MFRYLIAENVTGVMNTLLFALLVIIVSPIAAVLAARKGHWSALLFSAISLWMGAICFGVEQNGSDLLTFCEIAGPILVSASTYSIVQFCQIGHRFAVLFSSIALLISGVCFYLVPRGWDPLDLCIIVGLILVGMAIYPVFQWYQKSARRGGDRNA